MSFLNLENRSFLVFGIANKKSVAFHIAKKLEDEGGQVYWVVHTKERRDEVYKLNKTDREVFVCDLEDEEAIEALARDVKSKVGILHGLVHSVAYANFEDGMKPFHSTSKKNFLQTVDVSCFSLISIANAFKDLLDERASVITISISTTEMAAESYGWMAPAKAALNSSICFLAKSFSKFSKIRFNAVSPGLLKTSSSAGIPGYLEKFLFAEKCTLREEAVQTSEVANAAVFLLSEASSGINAQQIVLDAGMRLNYFSDDIVNPVVKSLY